VEMSWQRHIFSEQSSVIPDLDFSGDLFHRRLSSLLYNIRI
jgi:hypothetical protein